MSNWLDEVEAPSAPKSVNEFDQVSNAIYNLLNMCSKIESLTRQLDRDTTNTKKTEATKKKLKKERETAKENFKKLSEDIQACIVSDKLNKDKQVIDKLKKNFQEVSDRFSYVNRVSMEKERELETRVRDRFTESGVLERESHSFDNISQQSQKQKQHQHHQQQQLHAKEEAVENEPKFVMMEYTMNTINTVDVLAKEKLNDLKNLETDMNELHDLFINLKDIVQEQQEDLNIVETNVESSAALVEEGVENIKFARKNATVFESFQNLFWF
jgi:hypothetical protein